jgi:DNA-binding MarR family transcriptional regulator
MLQGEMGGRARAGRIDDARLVRLAEFRASMRQFERHVEDAARRHGLTRQRFLLLLQVEGVPSDSDRRGVAEIAHLLRLSPHSVTELVDRAELAGLLVREQSSSDGRARRLRATPEGRRRLEATILDTEGYRDELRKAFEHLVERFNLAS